MSMQCPFRHLSCVQETPLRTEQAKFKSSRWHSTAEPNKKAASPDIPGQLSRNRSNSELWSCVDGNAFRRVPELPWSMVHERNAITLLAHAETCGKRCVCNVHGSISDKQLDNSNRWQTAGKLISFIWIFTMSVAHIKYQNMLDAQISKCVLVHYAALFCSWVQVCPCLSKCDSV